MNSNTMRNLSVDEVQDWLFNNGFSDKMEVLKACEVNGEFLVEMTETELTQDLGFTSADAQRLISSVSVSGASYTPTSTPYVPSAPAAYVPPTRAPAAFAAPAAPYTPSAAASAPIVDPSRLQQLEQENASLKQENQRLRSAPAPYVPSAAACAPDPRLQQLEQENQTLRAETCRLNGELQNMKSMYDQLLQSYQQVPPPQATYQQQPPAQPTYQQPPPPQQTYAPAQPQQTYQTQPYDPNQPQQQPQQAYAPAPAPPPEPSKTDGYKQTAVNTAVGAGKGAAGGAALGAVAGAILPDMDAGDGAKAGAAMGALGGGVHGMMKGKQKPLDKLFGVK